MNIVRNIRAASFFLLVVLALSMVPDSFAEEGMRVLILHSYHAEYKWTDSLHKGILESLEDYEGPLDISVEYMDSKRVSSESYLETLPEVYRQKYPEPFDVIISSDDNAYDFLRRFHDDLFSETPVVASGVNWMTEEELEEKPYITGVSENADIRGNIDVIREILPHVTDIHVIADNTTTGRKVRDKVRQLRSEYDRMQFHVIGDMALEDVADHVSGLSENSVVLLTVFFKDGDGEYHEFDKQAHVISGASSVPVFSQWSFTVIGDVVGGYVTSGTEQGIRAGKLAVRLLQGEDIHKIEPVMEVDHRLIFNHPAMERHGIDAQDLPDGSMIRNDPKTHEFRNLEEVGSDVAHEIRLLVDGAVNDTLELASLLEASDKNSWDHIIRNFSSHHQDEIWYNVGTDEDPIEQRKTIPTYPLIRVGTKEGELINNYMHDNFGKVLLGAGDDETCNLGCHRCINETLHMAEGLVRIGNVITPYTSKEEVFEGMSERHYGHYQEVIARDTMKQGFIRFSTQVKLNDTEQGVLGVHLDYRHLQETAKHVDPLSNAPIVSARYDKNYLLVFDHEGSTIIHPKPDNIRGFLPNGSLAGFNDGIDDRKGSIFNLYRYHRSGSYPKMAKTALDEKDIYTSSATDVSGRTKTTVTVPIIYDRNDTNLADRGVLGGVMVSVGEKRDHSSVEELKVQLKAKSVAEDISAYLRDNPTARVDDLRNDPVFRNLAVQTVGDTGYTTIIDSEDGIIYLHPQKRLENSDSRSLKEDLPEFWAIFNETIGTRCRENGGYYDWEESDGSQTEKYMYLACVDDTTQDGKELFVAATTYIDELEGQYYTDQYHVTEKFAFTKRSVEQKAEDVARQLEIYISAHPDMTINDLTYDPVFKDIAVQNFGDSGYTAIHDHDSLVNVFHPDPEVENVDMDNISGVFPDFHAIIADTRGGREASGVYEWPAKNGSLQTKYLHSVPLQIKTADGVGLSVSAVTPLLGEHELTQESDSAFVLEKISDPFSVGILIFAVLMLFFFMFSAQAQGSNYLKVLFFRILVSLGVISLFLSIILEASVHPVNMLFLSRILLTTLFLFQIIFFLFTSSYREEASRRVILFILLLGAILGALTIITSTMISTVPVSNDGGMRVGTGSLYPFMIGVIAILGVLSLIRSVYHYRRTDSISLFVCGVINVLYLGVILFSGMFLEVSWYVFGVPVLILLVTTGSILYWKKCFHLSRSTAMITIGAAILIIAMVFVLGTYAISSDIREHEIEHISKTLTASAKTKAQSTELLLESYTESFNLLKESIWKQGGSALFSPNGSSSDEMRPVMENALAAVPSIRCVSLLAENGRIHASTHSDMEGEMHPAWERISKDPNERQIFVSKHTEGVPLVYISGPLFDEEGSMKGIMVMTHSMDEIEGVMRGGTDSWRSEEAYLVNDNFMMLTPSRFVENAALRLRVDSKGTRSCLSYDDIGHESFTTYKN